MMGYLNDVTNFVQLLHTVYFNILYCQKNSRHPLCSISPISSICNGFKNSAVPFFGVFFTSTSESKLSSVTHHCHADYFNKTRF